MIFCVESVWNCMEPCMEHETWLFGRPTGCNLMMEDKP